jgi:MerR family transcriptional regulator/heat shock protein HspR
VVNPGWADVDRGLFSISVAAELAGLHPQTLRIYEREGLLDPARSAGGTRRYSRRDIDRLAQICALTAEGLNLAGIRRVLALQQETRRLQAELARLRALAGDHAAPGPASGTGTGTGTGTPQPRPRAGRGTGSPARPG